MNLFSFLANVMKNLVCITGVTTGLAEEPKEVNIALETVLRFGNKNPSPGLAVIDKVQTALENIKKDIEVGNGRRSNPKDMTFTDFTAEAAKILKEYNDNDLEDVFVVIGEETKKYINREAELQRWFGGDNVRRHLNEQLVAIKEMDADFLRDYLDKAINAAENKKYKGEKNDLLDIGNYLYVGGSQKLKSALRNLDKLRKSSDVRLDNVIREILIFVFFDHFTKLNNNVKRELLEVIADYFKINRRTESQNIRPIILDPVENDEYSHESNNHIYKNKLNVKDEKRNIVRLSDTGYIKKINTVHKNKRYNYISKIQQDREAVAAYTKLHKLKQSTRFLSVSEEANGILGSAIDKKLLIGIITDKTQKTTRKTKVTTTRYTPSMKQSKSTLFKKDRETTKPVLLTGGQREDRLRVQTSSEETYDEFDDTKEEPKSLQAIVTMGRSSKPNVTPERFTEKEETYFRKVNNEEDEQVTSTINETNVSVEGMSIEDFEKDNRNIEYEVIRKYNKAPTPKVTVTKAENVKIMIKNIGIKIKDVKEQFDLVKNLTISKNDSAEKPTFRASNDKKVKSKVKSKHHFLNSASLEKNNEEFFLLDSSERKINATKKPKLDHDAKNITVKSSTVTKMNQTDTTKAVVSTTKSTVKQITTTQNDHQKIKEKTTVKNITDANNSMSNTTTVVVNKNISTTIRTTNNITMNKTIVRIGIEDHYTFNPLLV